VSFFNVFIGLFIGVKRTLKTIKKNVGQSPSVSGRLNTQSKVENDCYSVLYTPSVLDPKGIALKGICARA
jgi:hypothetical protein